MTVGRGTPVLRIAGAEVIAGISAESRQDVILQLLINLRCTQSVWEKMVEDFGNPLEET